jgi:hypothetical protein
VQPVDNPGGRQHTSSLAVWVNEITQRREGLEFSNLT